MGNDNLQMSIVVNLDGDFNNSICGAGICIGVLVGNVVAVHEKPISFTLLI